MGKLIGYARCRRSSKKLTGKKRTSLPPASDAMTSVSTMVCPALERLGRPLIVPSTRSMTVTLWWSPLLIVLAGQRRTCSILLRD